MTAETLAHTTASTRKREPSPSTACKVAASNLPEAGVSARPGGIADWNANSHADRHGHGCPSAPAMQHSGGTGATTALHR
jgi:hypothetical protein